MISFYSICVIQNIIFENKYLNRFGAPDFRHRFPKKKKQEPLSNDLLQSAINAIDSVETPLSYPNKNVKVKCITHSIAQLLDLNNSSHKQIITSLSLWRLWRVSLLGNFFFFVFISSWLYDCCWYGLTCNKLPSLFIARFIYTRQRRRRKKRQRQYRSARLFPNGSCERIHFFFG